ncbi:MAG: hypothetical protein U0V02_07850 [Anaerolineales bacterium]
MNIGIEIEPKVLYTDRVNKCKIVILNNTRDHLSEFAITVSDEGRNLLILEAKTLKPSGSISREVDIKVSEKYPREIEVRSLDVNLIYELTDGQNREENLKLEGYYILPENDPYIAQGIPTNSSFQGRETFYADLKESFSGVAALFLDAPGCFGKTSFLRNISRQPYFEHTSIVFLDAGIGNAAVDISNKDLDDLDEFSKQLAQVVFETSQDRKSQMDLRPFLKKVNKDLSKQDKNLLIIVDGIEGWLESAQKNPTELVGLHKIRNIFRDEDPDDYKNIKWIFSGSWSLNPDLSAIWSEHLSGYRIHSTRRFSTLDNQTGRRVVTIPVKGLVEFEEDALDRIGYYTGWHPHLIQILCDGIYKELLNRGGNPPWAVDDDLVNLATNRHEVINSVNNVWGRTLASFKGANIVLSILAAIKSLPNAQATENQILNMIAAGPLISREDLSNITKFLDLPYNAVISQILPEIIKYLFDLGLINLVDSNPQRYQLSAGLFARYF